METSSSFWLDILLLLAVWLWTSILVINFPFFKDAFFWTFGVVKFQNWCQLVIFFEGHGKLCGPVSKLSLTKKEVLSSFLKPFLLLKWCWELPCAVETNVCRRRKIQGWKTAWKNVHPTLKTARYSVLVHPNTLFEEGYDAQVRFLESFWKSESCKLEMLDEIIAWICPIRCLSSNCRHRIRAWDDRSKRYGWWWCPTPAPGSVFDSVLFISYENRNIFILQKRNWCKCFFSWK